MADPTPQSLKDARERVGMKQREVAEKAGCSVSLVCMVEKGYQPKPVVLAAMAEAVGASYGSFWPS